VIPRWQRTEDPIRREDRRLRAALALGSSGAAPRRAIDAFDARPRRSIAPIDCGAKR
jgi:hypothetical protein